MSVRLLAGLDRVATAMAYAAGAALLAVSFYITADVLGEPPELVSADTMRSDLDSWDSIAHLNLVVALEDEFSLAATMIKARASAGLTQEQLAQRMNTTQAVIARLESGRVKPSTRTLERLAHATGMKLRISFEPAPAQ